MPRTFCESCLSKNWRHTETTRRYFECQADEACDACASQYFGHYDLRNPALQGVLNCREERRKLRWQAARSWDAKEALARLQVAYATRVRSLSRAHLKRFPSRLNPKGHRIGRTGLPQSYQLDHIVPVIMCWEHYVPPEDAADMRNLQAIPWSVNLMKSGSLCIECMIGYPEPTGPVDAPL